MVKKKLGEVLQERSRISAADLDQAIEEQRKSFARLGELLLQRGTVSKDDLVSALEEVSGFRYLDCRFSAVETAVLDLIPRSVALFHSALPVAREGRSVVTVMAEPQNLKALDELRFLCGAEISPRFGFKSEITEAIERCYAAQQDKSAEQLPFIEQVDTSAMQFFSAGSSQKNQEAVAEFEAELRNERTPAVRLVSAILLSASIKNASDIHIEPQALGTVVRIRVDGVLRELTHVPVELTNSLISRIKILADMDIAERRVPQDGRFLVQLGQHDLDLRVSTLPTRDGEKVVMRLLDPASARVSFTSLGLSEDNAHKLGAVLAKPQGMLLVTGPTGSGKSTTLYAALNVLRSPAVNIITVEDPIEYRIQEINQVQINPKAGLTFATCLRSMLRQDPNIIMVGEIRDTETAEIALQAAQTGHLVLSTLHTNDSVAAITRLLDLNIPGFLIASSVAGILAQRLVRKLCTCRERVALTPEHRSRLASVAGAGAADFDDSMYVPAGCLQCDGSGFRGRVAICELLVVNEQIRAAVHAGVRDEEMRALARSAGMRLMQDDALEKVRSGVTTLDEALRVVPFERADAARCRDCNQALAPAFLYCPYCGKSTRPVRSRRHSRPRGLRVVQEVSA